MYGNTAHIEHPDAYARAVKARILDNARKTWRETHPRAVEVEEFLAGRKGEDFLAQMAAALDKFGKLTSGQYLAVLKTIDARAQARILKATPLDGGQYLGPIGARVALKFTVKTAARKVWEDGGVTYLIAGETADGAQVFYSGSCALALAEGAVVSLKATVKKHGQHMGKAQTIIHRPRLDKPAQEPQA